MPVISFWFDFASTYSWLSAMRIASLAEDAGVTVAWTPFLLGPIFKAQGWETSPFNLYPAKGCYMWRDLERLAEAEGLVLKRPQSFPQFALTATRVAVAARGEPWLPPFCRALFTHEFSTGGDITTDEAVAAALKAAGVDPAPWLVRAHDPTVKQALRERGEAAARLGIFGAPSFVTEDGELFWGNDRLEAALAWAMELALS
jgi:2-hydroxychromene-2-carboxylate isomerase